jgi:hypothetical protein
MMRCGLPVAAIAAAAFGVFTPSGVRAQGAPARARVTGAATWSISPEYRDTQARSLVMQRRLLLAMADSMPERLYRDRATPVQRDFAQQIGHAAGEAHRVAAFAAGVTGESRLPDTAIAFASRAGLTAYINTAYDDLDRWLGEQSDASRGDIIDFYGVPVARWMVWDEISHYTTWTAGQVVANFRKNGMAPPAFHFFPGS